MPRVAVYKNGAFRTIAGMDIPLTHGRFRGKHDTGVPAGTTLGQPEQGFTITVAGTVIEDRHILGGITVQAPDVTIRRCRIESVFSGQRPIDAGSVPVSLLGNAYSLEIQDCDINGGILRAGQCVYIAAGHTAIRRCRVWGGTDGLRLNGTNVLLEDSWVYEQVQYPGGHDDATQILAGSNIIIRRNRLEIINVEDDTYYNAGLQIECQSGNLTNVQVVDNYFNGGNFSINGSTNPQRGFTATNVVFRRNRFGPLFRNGQVTGNVKSGAGSDWDNTNVVDATGVAV